MSKRRKHIDRCGRTGRATLGANCALNCACWCHVPETLEQEMHRVYRPEPEMVADWERQVIELKREIAEARAALEAEKDRLAVIESLLLEITGEACDVEGNLDIVRNGVKRKVERATLELSRELESSRAAHARCVERCIEVLHAVQDGCRCACTLSERDSGHRVDCWTLKIAGDVLADPSTLATEEWLRARDARIWEEGREASRETCWGGIERQQYGHAKAAVALDIEAIAGLPNPYAKREANKEQPPHCRHASVRCYEDNINHFYCGTCGVDLGDVAKGPRAK